MIKSKSLSSRSVVNIQWSIKVHLSTPCTLDNNMDGFLGFSLWLSFSCKPNETMKGNKKLSLTSTVVFRNLEDGKSY